jgi:hypothetical protein
VTGPIAGNALWLAQRTSAISIGSGNTTATRQLRGKDVHRVAVVFRVALDDPDQGSLREVDAELLLQLALEAGERILAVV